MRSAHADFVPSGDLRLWDKLEHLFGQDDMSVLEAVIGV
jgi:hypothetical protein